MKLKVRQQLGAGFTRLSTGLGVPRRLLIEVDDDSVQYTAGIHVQVDDGGPRVQRLELTSRPGGTALTKQGLAAFPLERLVRLGLASVAVVEGVTKGEDGTVVGRTYRPAAAERQREAWQALQPRRGRQPGTPERTQQLIEALAARYRQLTAAGEKQPKKQLKDEFHLSPSYIGKLLGVARSQGLLGPAPGPGRAGEAP